jgi:hypothetical protein
MAYRNLVTVLIVACAASVSSSGASAQKGGAAKPKPKVKACGITAIPLSVGNQWVYQPVAYPWPKDATGAEIKVPPEQLKSLPTQPQKVTITVADVVVAKDITTISLTEDIDGRVINTTLTCTATGLTASPDAFWFAGEPGGAWNLQLDAMERKGPQFPIAAGKIASNEWHDDLKTNWKRVATAGTTAELGSGKLELERHFVVTADEPVSTIANNFAGVHKIGLETHGRITVDGSESKPVELPEGMVSWLWVADGTGPVQLANSFFHAYQLAAVTIGK